MQVSLGTTDIKLDTDRRRGEKPAGARQEDDGAASVRQQQRDKHPGGGT